MGGCTLQHEYCRRRSGASHGCIAGCGEQVEGANSATEGVVEKLGEPHANVEWLGFAAAALSIDLHAGALAQAQGNPIVLYQPDSFDFPALSVWPSPFRRNLCSYSRAQTCGCCCSHPSWQWNLHQN